MSLSDPNNPKKQFQIHNTPRPRPQAQWWHLDFFTTILTMSYFGGNSSTSNGYNLHYLACPATLSPRSSPSIFVCLPRLKTEDGGPNTQIMTLANIQRASIVVFGEDTHPYNLPRCHMRAPAWLQRFFDRGWTPWRQLHFSVEYNSENYYRKFWQSGRTSYGASSTFYEKDAADLFVWIIVIYFIYLNYAIWRHSFKLWFIKK
jgi:hypothetical protein